MRTIGMLFGIPDAEQPAVRDSRATERAQRAPASHCR